MDAIVAVFSDWGIGADGTQQTVLRADRRHFVELTRGRTVIVGRRTLADFPDGRPLRGRRNIVLTRSAVSIDGAETARSAEEAVRLCGGDAVVLGGQSVFLKLLPFTDRVYVTKIELSPVSDSFFPNLDADPEWRVTGDGGRLYEGDVAYRFVTYERIKP